MIAINKDEKEQIQARFPNMRFVRTMRGDSKRHHYYMEESPGPMRFLRKIRYGIDEQPKKGRGRNNSRKNWNGKRV